MRGTATEEIHDARLCDACGIPLDSQYFDDSSVQACSPILFDFGEELFLARFELPPQYCGVLQYFSQYTDTFALSPAAIATPQIEWRLLINNHPVFPYIDLRTIINPWGYGSFPLNIRLDEDSTVELRARSIRGDAQINGTPAVAVPTVIGGRIVGRFWYNESYGGR